jgi:hypothetical protein
LQWARAYRGLDIATDSSLATSSIDGSGVCCYRPAIGSLILHADGEAYVEFTLAGGLDGVMLGIARATFDPTVSVEAGPYVYGAYATADGWMMEASSGNLYHDYISNQSPVEWVSQARFQAGEQVGMLLRGGRLSVYIGGERLGVMFEGLVGEFVWAADLTINAVRSVRIEARDAAEVAVDLPCCSTICYPCGSGVACDFCDGSCNSDGPTYCDRVHPEWDDNCNREC